MTLYLKIISMIIGISLIFLAIFWSSNPKSGAIVLFAGAALVFLGASKIGEIDNDTHKKRI